MQRRVSSLWGGKKVVLRQTPRAVTPFGGLSDFIELVTGASHDPISPSKVRFNLRIRVKFKPLPWGR